MAMSSMPGCLAGPGRAPDLHGPVQLRQLNKMGPWTRRERLRFLWYRLRLAVAEMNYATRRTVELQAPWISDYCPAETASTAIPLRPSSRTNAVTFRGLRAGAFPDHGCGTGIPTIEELS
jgi:hypothetical protein